VWKIKIAIKQNYDRIILAGLLNLLPLNYREFQYSHFAFIRHFEVNFWKRRAFCGDFLATCGNLDREIGS